MMTINFYFYNGTGVTATHSTGRLDLNNLIAVVCNELKDATYEGNLSRAVFRFDDSGDILEIRYWGSFRYFIDCFNVTPEEFLDTLKKLCHY